jgi:hypothetical protein
MLLNHLDETKSATKLTEIQNAAYSDHKIASQIPSLPAKSLLSCEKTSE